MLTKRDSYHQIIFQAGILGYVFSLPYHARFNSICLILLIVNWLVAPHLKQRITQALSNKYVCLFISVYILYLFGMLYTSNITAGNKILLKDLSLLFFPFLLSTTTISDSFKRKIFFTLLITLLLSTAVSYYLFYVKYLSVNDFYLTFSQGHFRDNYLQFLLIRPTYITLYLLFAVITIPYLIRYYRVKRNYKAIGFLSLVFLYFAFTAFLLSARMPLAAALLLFIFFLTRYCLVHKFYWGIAAGLAFVMSLIYISYSSPYLNKRFTEITETAFQPPTGAAHNSTNIRVGILYCAQHLVRENWFLGVGTGDSQDHLNRCYKDSGFSALMYQDNYNMHNAFLEIWLKNGIFAFILLLLIFLVPMAISLKGNNYLYFAFLVIFALTSLTESTFNTQKGVVFFSFFNSLLGFSMPYFKSRSVEG